MLIALAIFWGIIAYFAIGVLCCKAMEKVTHLLRWRTWYISKRGEFLMLAFLWPLTIFLVLSGLIVYPFSTYSKNKTVDILYNWVTK